MHFRPYPVRPRGYTALKCGADLQAFRVVTPMMLVVKDKGYACAFVNIKYVGGREARIVIF
jgi:hypothetical protein